VILLSVLALLTWGAKPMPRQKRDPRSRINPPLVTLDDFQLADIGLTRAEAEELDRFRSHASD
jgi:uncharacterized protein YjiS (DUF1127 family)